MKKFKLTLKSPLFIGNGNSNKADLYIPRRRNAETVFKINEEKAIEKLDSYIDNGSKKYANYLTEINKEIDQNVKDNKKVANRRSEQNLTLYLRRECPDKYKSIISDWINNNNTISKQEFKKYTTLDSGQIDCFLKTPDGTPLIPGSSIKGAIKTLLINRLVKQNKDCATRIFDVAKTLIKRNISADDIHPQLDDVLKQMVNCGFKDENGEESYDKSRYSIFNFLIVRDARVHDYRYAIVDTTILKGNRKKSETQSQSNYREVLLPEKSEITCEVGLDLMRMKQLLESSGQREWIELEQKLSDVFNLDANDIRESDETEIENQFFNSLFEFGQEFTSSVFAHYKKLHDDTEDKKGNSKALKSALFNDERTDTLKQANLLLGAGTGFRSNTLINNLLDHDNNNALKKLYQNLRIGLRGKKKELDTNLFPKSLRTAKIKYPGRSEAEYFQFGWIEISVFKDKANLEDGSSKKKENQENKKEKLIAKLKSCPKSQIQQFVQNDLGNEEDEDVRKEVAFEAIHDLEDHVKKKKKMIKKGKKDDYPGYMLKLQEYAGKSLEEILGL